MTSSTLEKWPLFGGYTYAFVTATVVVAVKIVAYSAREVCDATHHAPMHQLREAVMR